MTWQELKPLKINAGLFSSATGEWETPQWLFAKLDDQWHFTLDPAATKENAKCANYFTKEDDGLAHSWEGERVFLNPPYGRSIGLWVKKAYEEEESELVVCLLPARTDTKWFHDYVQKATDIEFLRGRLHFSGSKQSAPFPSMIVTFL